MPKIKLFLLSLIDGLCLVLLPMLVFKMSRCNCARANLFYEESGRQEDIKLWHA